MNMMQLKNTVLKILKVNALVIFNFEASNEPDMCNNWKNDSFSF